MKMMALLMVLLSGTCFNSLRADDTPKVTPAENKTPAPTVAKDDKPVTPAESKKIETPDAPAPKSDGK